MNRLSWLNLSFEQEFCEAGRRPSLSKIAAFYAADLSWAQSLAGDPSDLVVVDGHPPDSWLEHLEALDMTPAPVMSGLVGGIANFGAITTEQVRWPNPWGFAPFALRQIDKLRQSGVISVEALAHARRQQEAAEALGPKGSIANHFAEYVRDSGPSRCAGVEDVATVHGTFEDARQRCEAILESGRRAVIKRAWGSAGRGLKRVRRPEDFDASLTGWLERSAKKHGGVVVQPWLDKLSDLSVTVDISASGPPTHRVRRVNLDSRWSVRCIEISPPRALFGTDQNGSRPKAQLTEELQKTIDDWVTHWGKHAASLGFEGPMSLDTIVYRDQQEGIRVHPALECNARQTLGSLGQRLADKIVAPQALCFWLLLDRGTLQQHSIATNDPLRQARTKFADGRIASGVVFTNPPETSRCINSVLVIGDELEQEPWRTLRAATQA